MPGRLVVLGSCAAWPEPGRACSGLFVERDGYRVVVDLGYGTLPRLLDLLGSSTADGLGAVIVTHQHSDHLADLHGLWRARRYGRPSSPPLPLFAPEGVWRRLAAMEDDDPIETVFDWWVLPGPSQPLGPWQLESVAVPHFVPSAGVRLSTAGCTVAYTGDTAPHPVLSRLGHAADVYVVEATGLDQSDGRAGDPTKDLTGRQAGEVAAEAEPGRLLLTHFWPGNDRERTRREAASAWKGEILLADEGLEIPLP